MQTDIELKDLEPGCRLEDHERTRCEVWTRVMGYHRPVSAFNEGKKSEHRERVSFREQGSKSGLAPASTSP